MGNLTLRGAESQKPATPQATNWEIAPGSTFIERPVPVAGAYASPRLPPVQTEDYLPAMPNRFLSPVEHGRTPLPITKTTASYALVRRHLNTGQLPPGPSIRLEELYNYFDYGYPKPEGEEAISVLVELAPTPWDQKRNLLLIGIRAHDLTTTDAKPANLVFMVDTSGSMAAEQKLPLIKDALQELTALLRDQDRISIVAYAGDVSWLLDSCAGHEKERIKAAISRLTAGSVSSGDRTINLAYEVAREQFIWKGQNRVIHCSDGDFSFGPSLEQLERLVADQAEYGITFHTMGFGMGLYQDPNMRGLATAGKGSYSYIDNTSEAERVFRELIFEGSQHMVEDVKLMLEPNDGVVKAFRYLGFTSSRNGAAEAAELDFPAGSLAAGESKTIFIEWIPRGSKEQIPGLLEAGMIQNEDAPMGIVWLQYRNPVNGELRSSRFILNEGINTMESSSDSFRFAASVLGFGIKLQDVEEFGALPAWPMLKDLARQAGAVVQDGQRAEFIRLLDTAERLQEHK